MSPHDLPLLSAFRVRGLTGYLVWLIVYTAVLHFTAVAHGQSPLSEGNVSFELWPVMSAAAAVVLPVSLGSEATAIERGRRRSIALVRLTVGLTYSALTICAAYGALAAWPNIVTAGVRNATFGLAAGLLAAVLLPPFAAWTPWTLYLMTVFLFGVPRAGVMPAWARPLLEVDYGWGLATSAILALVAFAIYVIRGSRVEASGSLVDE